jgi:hypothetical protein
MMFDTAHTSAASFRPSPATAKRFSDGERDPIVERPRDGRLPCSTSNSSVNVTGSPTRTRFRGFPLSFNVNESLI